MDAGKRMAAEGHALKIIVVDDDEHVRIVVTRQLATMGHCAVSASDGHEALRLMGTAVPDIVITDVRMPEMHGGEFVSLLRKKYPAMPVLVISAFDLPEELDGYPFLRKPFKIEEIMDIIDAQINIGAK